MIRRARMTRHLLFMLAALGTTAGAQWLNYPAPGIPRLSDGKPDLSGLWESESVRQGLFDMLPALVKPEDVVLTPDGEAWQRQHKENHFLDVQCLPIHLLLRARGAPFKVLSLRGMVVILYEIQTTYRQ